MGLWDFCGCAKHKNKVSDVSNLAISVGETAQEKLGRAQETPLYRKFEVIVFTFLSYQDIFTDLFVAFTFITDGKNPSWGWIAFGLCIWMYWAVAVAALFLAGPQERIPVALSMFTLYAPLGSARAAWRAGNAQNWSKSVIDETGESDKGELLSAKTLKIAESVAESTPESFFQLYIVMVMGAETSGMQRFSIVSSLLSVSCSIFSWRKSECMGDFPSDYSMVGLFAQCAAECAFKIITLAMFASAFKVIPRHVLVCVYDHDVLRLHSSSTLFCWSSAAFS